MKQKRLFFLNGRFMENAKVSKEPNSRLSFQEHCPKPCHRAGLLTKLCPSQPSHPFARNCSLLSSPPDSFQSQGCNLATIAPQKASSPCYYPHCENELCADSSLCGSVLKEFFALRSLISLVEPKHQR